MDQSKQCPWCFEVIDGRAVRCPKCASRQPDAPGLYRDAPGRLVGGVCAGLASSFGWDVTVMRVVFLALGLVSGGLVLWAYAALWILTPFTAGGRSPGLRAADWVGRLFSPPAGGPSDSTGSGVGSIR